MNLTGALFLANMNGNLHLVVYFERMLGGLLYVSQIPQG